MKKLPTFLLDTWLESFRDAPIEHDLATSTGPLWRLADLFERLAPAERERLETAALGYSHAEGAPAVREAVAAVYDADPAHVIVTTGASEALHLLFADAAAQGGNVVVSLPGFPPTIEIPAALGLEVRTYRLRPENGFRVDADEVAALLDANTRLLLVTSPHNPTGAVLAPDELAALHALAAGRGVPLVSDEMYGGITFGAPPRSAAGLPGTIVLSSLSKTLGLPGLRLGWLIDPDPGRRARLLNGRMYFTISGNPLAESLAVAALRDRDSFVGHTLARAEANLELLDRFVESQPRLDWVRPAGGTTAFPWRVDGEDSRPLCRAFAAAGVLTAPGDCFGMPRHLRIGFACEERFAEALATMAHVLAAEPGAAAAAGPVASAIGV